MKLEKISGEIEPCRICNHLIVLTLNYYYTVTTKFSCLQTLSTLQAGTVSENDSDKPEKAFVPLVNAEGQITP